MITATQRQDYCTREHPAAGCAVCDALSERASGTHPEPDRADRMMYGMFDMDSIPPATTTFDWPSWIDCAPSMIAFIPDAHT